MDWENHLEKNPIQKIEKSKNQSEIAACEQKPLANFCSKTVFLLHFKNRMEKFYDTKQYAFSLHFLFRRDKITTPFRLQKS